LPEVEQQQALLGADRLGLIGRQHEAFAAGAGPTEWQTGSTEAVEAMFVEGQLFGVFRGLSRGARFGVRWRLTAVLI